jgi:RHS repeat-associated protein
MALGMRIAMKGLGKGLKKLRKMQKGSKRMAKLSKKLNKAADKACKKLKIGDVGRNRARKAICTVTGHPVDVATGKVFTDKIDFELPGPIPFKWERTWYSTSTYEGPLGHGWHHSYDMGLHVEEEVVLVRMNDGRFISAPPLETGQEHFDRAERITFFRDHVGYGILDLERLCYRFSAIDGSREDLPLISISDRTGTSSIHFGYDRAGRLAQIDTTGGQRLNLLNDDAGRITGITAPHPDKVNERVTVVRYRYDDAGNLLEVLDALEQSATFQYAGHLMVQETDRNGLSFYFEYDAADETARCVHTWGDGGIYDHKLAYDDELGITVIENSLGYKTEYQHQGGLVVSTTDARGATSLTEYNEYNQVVKETDALGNEISYAYDDHGNSDEVTGPDGATVTYTHDGNDNLVEATDSVGGKWQWAYDAYGRLTNSKDSLGYETLYRWHGSQLIEILDSKGGSTRLGYDGAGNLTSLVYPGGDSKRRKFDLTGRMVSQVNSGGAIQKRTFDDLNRVTRVEEPDGNVRRMVYDAEGNIIHIKDKLHDVRFEYQGMGKISARGESGTMIQFEYDTEENLTAVTNEEAQVYGFIFGPTGEVMEEHYFDGTRRCYKRDLLGRVLEVERPGERWSRYGYDGAGRISKVEHSDGSGEEYEYRADGELMEAGNQTATVTFERDLLGRIVKESQGGHWVASEYSPLGLRSLMESSLGALQEIERNANGDVITVNGGFEASFERNLLGQELSRELPGGVHSRWQRDKLGRPLSHKIWSNDQNWRHVRYEWRNENRLDRIINADKGPTRFGHDLMGNLAWTEYPDGSRQLRVPDQLGNLYRTEDRSDRKYGLAGQLLESTDEKGRVTRYEYDDEGNLSCKIAPFGRVWRYHWNGAGMLERVDRPDNKRVWFTYDALGRRLSKTFRGKTTRWVWDGHRPLHEWVEDASVELRDETWDEKDVVRNEDDSLLAMYPPTGPPVEPLEFQDGDYLEKAASAVAPVTWLFEPESFAPMARLEGDRRESIITDHVGTPLAMFDDEGELSWAAETDSYGGLRDLETGERAACPFRFPGQYEDQETGLCYNRFRYYDSEAGRYISQDPLGQLVDAYNYVRKPETSADPLGLAEWVDPNDLNFSQGYVTGETETYEKAMRDGEWDWDRKSKKGNPVAVLTVVEVDGKLVSMDNRRLLAAQNAGLDKVKIVKVKPGDAKPGGGTWGDSLKKRLNSRPQTRPDLPKIKLPPTGTPDKPKVVSKTKPCK